jgi:hypothetical protein
MLADLGLSKQQSSGLAKARCCTAGNLRRRPDRTQRMVADLQYQQLAIVKADSERRSAVRKEAVGPRDRF